MFHLLVSFVVFGGVMVFTAVIFVVWLVVNIIRLIARAITGSPQRSRARGGETKCNNGLCGALNPPAANYCRRCGSALRRVTPEIPVRREQRWQVQSGVR
jgi:hypothetical protein